MYTCFFWEFYTYIFVIEWGRSFGSCVNPASLHMNSWWLASQRQTSPCTGQELLSCGNWAPAQCCCSCSADITTAANNSRRMLLCRARVSVHFSLHTEHNIRTFQQSQRRRADRTPASHAITELLALALLLNADNATATTRKRQRPVLSYSILSPSLEVSFLFLLLLLYGRFQQNQPSIHIDRIYFRFFIAQQQM